MNQTIGAGIFAQPVTVLRHAGSSGVAILLWIAAGLIVYAIMVCWLELGMSVPFYDVLHNDHRILPPHRLLPQRNHHNPHRHHRPRLLHLRQHHRSDLHRLSRETRNRKRGNPPLVLPLRQRERYLLSAPVLPAQSRGCYI